MKIQFRKKVAFSKLILLYILFRKIDIYFSNFHPLTIGMRLKKSRRDNLVLGFASLGRVMRET